MHILFYLSKQNIEKVNNYFVEYIKNYIVKLECKIILICETQNDKKDLQNSIEKTKHLIEVYNLYENLNNNKKKYNFLLKNIDQNTQHYFKIEPEIFNYYKNYNISDYIYKFYKNLYEKYNFNFVSINFSNGTFSSLGTFFLDNFCKKNNIKILFPFPSPFNGKFIIYDSIFLDNIDLDNSYNELLNRELSINEESKAIEFINKYNLYEQNYSYRKSRFKISNTRYSSLKKYYRFFKYFVKKNYFYNKKNNYFINKNHHPYILFLLTKTDSHWFTNYANPDLTNRIKNIEYVYKSLPHGFNLVLKPHPRVQIEKDIENYILDKENIYIAYDYKNENASYNLIKHSEIVIGYGSTSLVLPLLQYKNVIDVGKYSAYFNFKNAPVQKIENFKEVGKAIKLSMQNKVSEHKIHSYIIAILKNSYSFLGDEELIEDFKPMNKKYIIANKIIELINKF